MPSQKSDSTKYRLAEAMKTCMKTMPVDKITVREIVETCNTTRQTFYRYFQDKFDLINWYFDKVLLESFAHMGEGKTVYEGLCKKFAFIKQERVFFSAAFRYDEQNSLKQHDFELILAFYTDRIREKTKGEPSQDMLFSLELYCYGSIYMTVKWVLSGMKESPCEMAAALVKAMPQNLSELFLRLHLIEPDESAGKKLF